MHVTLKILVSSSVSTDQNAFHKVNFELAIAMLLLISSYSYIRTRRVYIITNYAGSYVAESWSQLRT